MKIRTFWILFLKIIGLYIFLGSIEVVAQFFSSTYYLFVTESSDTIIKTGVFGVIAVIIFTYILFSIFFVFKPNLIIDKLKLDKGFEEGKIDLSDSSSSVLKIAVIIIGGLMLVNSFPALCRSVFAFFQQESLFRNYPKAAWIIFDLLKTIIAYLLLTNSKLIVKIIEKQKSN
jgi:hypothetical protein